MARHKKNTLYPYTKTSPVPSLYTLNMISNIPRRFSCPAVCVFESLAAADRTHRGGGVPEGGSLGRGHSRGGRLKGMLAYGRARQLSVLAICPVCLPAGGTVLVSDAHFSVSSTSNRGLQERKNIYQDSFGSILKSQQISKLHMDFPLRSSKLWNAREEWEVSQASYGEHFSNARQ
jgi:hypothetical protein